MVNTIIITYCIGCIWYRVVDEFFEEENNFIDTFELKDKTIFEQFVISCYFAITTFSTVGYGDYFPITINEKIFGSIIMLTGVTIFSILMTGFLDVI